MAGRDVGVTGESLHVQRLGVLPIDAVPHAAQQPEIAQALLFCRTAGHPCDISTSRRTCLPFERFDDRTLAGHAGLPRRELLLTPLLLAIVAEGHRHPPGNRQVFAVHDLQVHMRFGGVAGVATFRERLPVVTSSPTATWSDPARRCAIATKTSRTRMITWLPASALTPSLNRDAW